MFGRGSSSRRFQDSFRCHSVSLLAAEQQRDEIRLEYSDKIILPPSCLEKLAHLEISYPMMFEISKSDTSKSGSKHKLHCGVLEFVAQEGMVYLPYWMMENMGLNEGDIVTLRSATLPKGKYVKLQPQTTDFIRISNPKAVLEQSLRNFSALSKGETFRIYYNKRKYDIGVVEVKPEGGTFPPGAPQAVCIIETDIILEFEAPADYVEPIPTAPSASPPSSSPLEKSPIMNPLPPPALDGDSSDDEDRKPPAFTGAGFRLDGKALKQQRSTAATPSGSMISAGAPTRVGVRIGSDTAGSSQAPAAQTLGGRQPESGSQPAVDAASGDGDDYWAKLSGGNKLR